ncbi:hypothetical protein OPV22_029271 [Ensete ventricosum]|uniref:Uncharacterized protein n=1 Tax=Ensete ventricosum TaxID=4639 RepID=A0AAV8QD27_ENSVE|nr:hypothetical protein OPV22_029271 [Ensete ventricosum]
MWEKINDDFVVTFARMNSTPYKVALPKTEKLDRVDKAPKRPILFLGQSIASPSRNRRAAPSSPLVGGAAFRPPTRRWFLWMWYI